MHSHTYMDMDMAVNIPESIEYFLYTTTAVSKSGRYTFVSVRVEMTKRS